MISKHASPARLNTLDADGIPRATRDSYRAMSAFAKGRPTLDGWERPWMPYAYWADRAFSNNSKSLCDSRPS